MRYLKTLICLIIVFAGVCFADDCSTSASNMVSYSDDMTNSSGWTKGSTTVTDDSVTTTPPQGRYGVTKTFKHVLFAGQSNTTYGNSGSSIPYMVNYVPYKISAYVKYSSAQYTSFGIVGGATYACGFDLVNGTVGTCSGMNNPAITNVGNGWWYLEGWVQGNSSLHPISRLLFQNLSSSTYSATLPATGGEIIYISSPQAQPSIDSREEMLKYVPVSTYTRTWADSRTCAPTERNLFLATDLSDARWVASGVTKATSIYDDYSGLYRARLITGDGATSSHKIYYDMKDPGVGEVYFSVEVYNAGSAPNVWVGNESASHYWGIDLDLTTGAVVPNTHGRLRGWKVEKLNGSYWRIHLLATEVPTDSATYTMTLAIGNGTASNTAPSFASSGSLLFARPFATAAYNIPKELRDQILPDLQTASSTTSVTLAAISSNATSMYVNREICFPFGYNSTVYGEAHTTCSCITAYNGTTKVATLLPALAFTPDSNNKYKIGGVCLNNPSTVTSVTGNVAGSVGSVTGAVGSVTATTSANVVSMDANTVGSSQFTQAAADKVWNTAPQDGSSSTALGYLDAIKKYVANKLAISGSNYTVYKDDQTTTFATGTSNSAGRDPD